MIPIRRVPVFDALPVGNSGAMPHAKIRRSDPEMMKLAIWIQPDGPSDNALTYMLNEL
jgi:hypothetical protein